MKKIYTILAAAAIAFNATADNLSVNINQDLTLTNQLKAHPGTADYKAPSVKKFQGARKVDVNKTIEGRWDFYLGDYYMEGSVNAVLIYEFTARLEGAQVIFEDPEGVLLPFKADYNKANGNLSFYREDLGPYKDYYLYQMPFVVDDDTYEIVYGSAMAFYDKEYNTMHFDEECGIGWQACKDAAGEDPIGYVLAFDLVDAVKTSNELMENDEYWNDLGNATFMDSWVLPGFGFDQNDMANWFEVPVQQCTLDENLYRLVDPYHQPGFPALEYNESEEGGYILIDANDPIHLMINSIEKIQAGFANSKMGISEFYCYNMVGFYNSLTGYDTSYVVRLLGRNAPYTTLKDGVITLGGVDDDGEQWYDANFGFQNDPYGSYSWKTVPGGYTFQHKVEGATPLDMSARIYLPGAKLPDPEDNSVDEITVENGSAPRYFTLQGVEIARPEKGAVCVKIGGGKAKKIIIR